MARRTSTLLSDESGATAVEYGLIVALIVLAMMAALMMLADTTATMWDDVSNKVEDASQQ